jgi:acylphosphatase
MRAVQVIIKGKVQGVFFRVSVEKLANEKNVNGFVRNREKLVVAYFEGEDEAVADMLEFCVIGPNEAKVRSIEIMELPYEKTTETFVII